MHPLAVCLFVPALLLVFDAARRVNPGGVRQRMWWALVSVALFIALSFEVALPGHAALGYQGAAFAALLLGYCRALLTMSVVLALTCVPALWGMHLLIDAFLPVMLMCVLVSTLRAQLPANPFVFLFGAGFFGLFAIGAVQLLVSTAGQAALSTATGFDADALGYGLLLLGGEATLEGMLVTLLVVYRAEWVALFDDEHYLAYRNAV